MNKIAKGALFLTMPFMTLFTVSKCMGDRTSESLKIASTPYETVAEIVEAPFKTYTREVSVDVSPSQEKLMRAIDAYEKARIALQNKEISQDSLQCAKDNLEIAQYECL